MFDFNDKSLLINRIMIVLLSQTVVLLIIARLCNYYSNQFDYHDLLITGVSLLNFLAVVFMIIWIQQNQHLYIEVCNQKKHILTMNQAITIIREERHELLNHIQEIECLIFSNERSEAKKYLQNIITSCHINSNLINISNPTLQTLLSNYYAKTSAKGIDFKVLVESDLKLLNMQPAAITTVFGNLINNAIEYVQELSPEYQKNINFNIRETDKNYYFYIQNSGPSISEEIAENMFNKGFSVKGEGRGFGLAQVLSTISSYGGQIFFNQEDMSFTVIVPKSGDN